jgi:hypothetical protein
MHGTAADLFVDRAQWRVRHV